MRSGNPRGWRLGWTRNCTTYGALAGVELLALGTQANANHLVFRPVDSHGRRIDHAEFHPAWHRLMRLGTEHGVTGFARRHAGREDVHVARAALMFPHYQAEQGSACPLAIKRREQNP